MKKQNVIVIIMLSILILGILFACFPFNQGNGDYEDIEIKGTWLDEGENWKQKLVITNTKITNYWSESLIKTNKGNKDDNLELFWEARIYKFDNEKWNGEEFGSGDHGYMVLKYTIASEVHPEAKDKYMVLRWKSLTTSGDVTTMSWSEGYKKDPDPDNYLGKCGYPEVYCGLYFDTYQEAIDNATDGEGFFGMYSEITKEEEVQE